MPRHHVERVLPYAPDQLFELVGAVERYPEFVPWITSMRAEPPRELSPGVDERAAEAGVGFSFLTERFTTSVRRDRPAATIEVGLIRGPFRRLSNRWRFIPEGKGTRVVFDIDFAFKARLLDVLLAANFDLAVNRLIACFEARAAALYGAPAAR
ncbi:MAG: type II toxin-antitoxin system RatA family toxin [Caulobacteraceae bacterium]|nr:type II toxin-antitoxin system RatA family toxin [Caulobacter sp.]